MHITLTSSRRSHFRGNNVPIDLQSSHKDLKFLLEDSESKFIFTSKKLLPSLTPFISHKQQAIVIDKENSSSNIISFSALLNSNPNSNISFPQLESEQIASIVYTSGTTGLSKGVILTHKNFYANFSSITKLPFVFYENNILSILPLHHTIPFLS